ncbi:hypothetical protein EV13_3003 [Prochlorococcus sp. MIT 0702]|nr:hypothetical protein EV12_2949 [Prochlorococcus sp. MIT 0701]KGG26221.1 hypothetical protein EV13_3003 [Prochlorococcus sp. MIT 0702]KGG33045.1 hypothetical protein EV14_1886 [Prochlorococcus sp. MIT 0703]
MNFNAASLANQQSTLKDQSVGLFKVKAAISNLHFQKKII